MSSLPLANLVTLGARDLDRLRRFYQDVGWPVVLDDGQFVAFELGGIVLAIFPRDELARDGGTSAAGDADGVRTTIGLTVESADEVDRLTERMRAAGARVTKEPVDAEFFPGRSAYLCDPEGNYFEIVWNDAPDNPVSVAQRRAAGLGTSYLASQFDLTGRTAIVTGGSSGIGRAIATALARAGANVVIVARGVERLDAVVGSLRSEALSAAPVAGDLSTADGARAAADDAARVFGEPDILVNSAANNLRPPMGELDDGTWNETLALNLTAPFVLGQRFGPGMADRGYGRIVNISSQQAHRAFVNSGAYGVSKGGLESLTRSQAEAWSSRGVTSNTLVPGFVLTALNRRLASDPVAVTRLAERTMIGRNGLAEDFAGVAVFLASPSSAYITGQSIFVDGGLSVH